MQTLKAFDPLVLFHHYRPMVTLSADLPQRIGVNGHPLTTEQEEILSQAPDRTLKWQAFAGCAKTTTSVEYTHAWPKFRPLYLAFNTSIASDAKGRFPNHVKTQTAHGHAYQSLKMNRFRDRLVNRLRPNDLDMCSDLLRPFGNMTELAIQRAAIKSLGNFLISAENELEEHHLAGVPIQLRQTVLPMFAAVVERFMDFEGNNLPITHDIYLKAFARSNRISDNFDYLIIDEAQDLNPVLISIVRNAERPSMIVGDPWQSIYSFRGAISAMDSFKGPVLPLSQSFRFGPQIAAIANHVLQHSLERPAHPIIGNPLKKSIVEEYHGKLRRRSTILARTNFRLFESLARTSLPFHVVGGVDEMINQIAAGYALFIGVKPKVLDPIVSRFIDWEACRDAANHEDEPELGRLVKIVERYTHDLPDILAGMRQRHTPDENQATIIVSTAHRAKGREWPNVVVLDDFLPPSELRAMLGKKRLNARDYNQEINLIYVTLTRAIETIAISSPLFEEIGSFGL